ncbi:MAG: heavy metal-binding domain-containing protein [Acidimicrobiales bacterium]
MSDQLDVSTSQARLRDNAAGTCFTSDLSVNEFLLVRETGFEPLGMVVGSSIYHIGIQVARWGKSQELTVLTAAMYNARELAMRRMEAEAAELGADGIVGVRIDMNMYAWGEFVAEFVAVGTAVRSVSRPGEFRSGGGRPFTSDLSGQDFYTLWRAGHFPVAFVFGTCVYHVAHQGMFQSVGQVGRNVEMPQFTQALYDARELAMGRMQAEGERDGGTGIVGVRLVEQNHVWGEHALEFLAMGTAVRAFDLGGDPPAPGLVLPLSG